MVAVLMVWVWIYIRAQRERLGMTMAGFICVRAHTDFRMLGIEKVVNLMIGRFVVLCMGGREIMGRLLKDWEDVGA
ncbi:MAG: hypothetical protein HF970_03125 [ANME-2 cluster archaeon]|nr:hypothetical protein [ANME-2 cluster archaeon]